MKRDAIFVEPDGSNDGGPCPCCGGVTRTVWGYISAADGPLAVYYVIWTLGRVDHGARIDFIVGEWGEGTSARNRSIVAVAYRPSSPKGAQFAVVDAEGRPAAKPGKLADSALRADQVVGTPLEARILAMLNAVFIRETRIEELKRSIAR